MKILGNLVTAKGPHRKVVVAVATLEPGGKLRAATEQGLTDAHGACEFEVATPEASVLPRIFLRIRRGAQWVIVADAPRQQTAKRVEFGEVLVTSKRVRRSGGRPVFGVLASEETERSGLLASIAAQEAELAEASAQRAALDQELLAKDQELSALRTSVENTTASLAGKDAEIATLTAELERLTAEYEERFLNPFAAAELGYLDAVIQPHETRARMIQGLQLLETKRDTNPTKKHGNLPL